MQQETIIKELQNENQFLKLELDRIKEVVRLLKRDLFGSKSERITEISPDQLVFNEIEKEAATLEPFEKSSEENTEEVETITYDRKKGRGKKKPFPENLVREEKIIDLDEKDKFCPHDGTPLKEIGEERTEKFKTIPAQMSVLVEIKKKYACPCCESFLAQPKSNSVLPGTIATPELISFLVFSKFFQGLPLYRLEELFKLNGVSLTRGTMARWLIQVSEKLMPIYNLLQEKVFDTGYMAIDATNVQVLKEHGKSAKSKSFMWVRGSPERGIVLFDYDPYGGGAVARKLTTEFKGALQADAHRGYAALDKSELTLLGCMMHSRRRFHEAFLGGNKKRGIASEALAIFKWLYEREEHYKKTALTPEARKEIRDREIGPSLDTMKEWAIEKSKLVPKTSKIGNALHYFINEFSELTAFLKNGRFEIDNGWVERTIRKFAIGRNNWLFCDTVEGAQASSLLYSLTITAKLNGKDPFKTLTEILQKLPDATIVDDYEALTELLLSPYNPDSIQKKN